MKITFCIPSKNNLRYLKNSIRSIKQNSTQEHDIFVYLDADNDGTEPWLIDNRIPYLKNDSETPKGIAYAYNRCIEAATTEIVCMFHADMFMGKGFDTNTLKHLKPGVVVSATRIEPPLHPQGLEKIVQDFGMYPEDFMEETFNTFVEEHKAIDENKTTRGIFAPWLCYKSDILAIGLHDEEFQSYHEDSDIFNRMLLSGMSCIQSRDAFVYHLTCRGGQFQDGIEKVTSDEAFHKMKNIAMKHYLRKWGSWIKNDEYQHPVLTPKYSVAFVIRNCNLPLLEALEPWCDRIYVEERFNIGRAWDYVEMEQSNTKFDLSKRVLTSKANDPISENDIVVEFDATQLTNENFQIVQQLSQIIAESGEVGQFELDIFKITISSLQTYEKHLITKNDPYYTSQLL
jgi:glycosyltransferase involved in cell wall biosynthesis